MDRRQYSEEVKKSMVSLANTCSNPRAMMIMDLYTGATVATVERARWAQNITRAALCNLYLLASDSNQILIFIAVIILSCTPSFLNFLLLFVTISYV